MTPTTKLRFVERRTEEWNDVRDRYEDKFYNVLQQWWERTFLESDGVWRDVPVEVEE